MFRLMRNLHLIFGLMLFVFTLVFAVSSLVIIYRPWLPQSREDTGRTVQVAAENAATPRALALDMMRHHDLNGDLRDIEQTEDGLRFVVTLPGTRAEVVYSRASGEAKIETRRQGFLETLVLGSIGLFLLGATGIYLWFCHNEERVIGSVLLVVGLIYGITTLVLSIRTVRFRMGLQAEGAPDPADGHAPPLRKLNITRLHPTERCG